MDLYRIVKYNKKDVLFKITGVRLTLYHQRNYNTIIIVLGVVSLFLSKPSIVTLSKSVTMNQFLNSCLKVILFIPIQYSFQLHYGNVRTEYIISQYVGRKGVQIPPSIKKKKTIETGYMWTLIITAAGPNG